jgi:hypothetical protein
MTFTEFMEKWNGQYLEVAGSSNALYQCVDLANAYLRDVLNHPIIEWTNAIDFPSKLPDFTYILNTPDGVPQEGDLVIWGGTYGHIAIFIEGDTNSFRSFDQNYPSGTPCHVQGHTYSNVIGWLRSRNETVSKEVYDACMVDRQKFWSERDTALAKVTDLEKKVIDLNRQLAEMASIMESIKNEDADAIENMHKVEKERDELRGIIGECLKEMNLSTEETNELSGALHDLVATLKSQKDDISNLEIQVDNLIKQSDLKNVPFTTLFGEIVLRIFKRR